MNYFPIFLADQKITELRIMVVILLIEYHIPYQYVEYEYRPQDSPGRPLVRTSYVPPARGDDGAGGVSTV